MSSVNVPVPPMGTAIGAIPEGKVVDFITGNYVNDTPEEYVRQNIEKALIRQYRYEPKACAPEFPIRVGSARKRVDVVVFAPGMQPTQEGAYILVETKRPDTSPEDKKEGIEQLKSYMSACPNALFGMWTNGDDRFCLARRVEAGKTTFEFIVDIPAAGQTEADVSRPKRKDLMPAAADNLKSHSAAATTTSPAQRECRSRTPSGNC